MAIDEKGLASVALTNDNGECRSCVEGQCMTGKNCVTLGWDAYGCNYCKDTGYLSDGNHCQWCAIPMAPATSSAATVREERDERTSSTIPGEFKAWFEHEWARYEDKAISDGKITSMAWALKGYRAGTVSDAASDRETRAIRLLEIAEPILEAAALNKAVTIAAADLLRQVRVFLPDTQAATTAGAQDEKAALNELSNIANAKRFDHETFADDTEFADWAQNRARHTLRAASSGG